MKTEEVRRTEKLKKWYSLEEERKMKELKASMREEKE